MVLCTSERVCVVTSVSCHVAFVPPIIDAGTPSDLPLEIDRENMNEKIGSTLHIVQGQSAMIQCSIFADTGLPIDSVNYTWYYMGMQITNGSTFMITVDDSRRSSTLMVNDLQRADNGQVTCVAFNPAGQSQASTEVFGECYTYMNTHMQTRTHTYTHARTHTHCDTHMHTCTHIHTHTVTHMHTHTVTHTCTHAHKHTHAHMHINTYMHVCMHVPTYIPPS